MNNNYFGLYRPMPQMNPSNTANKSFNNLNVKPGLQGVQGTNQT